MDGIHKTQIVVDSGLNAVEVLDKRFSVVIPAHIKSNWCRMLHPEKQF